MKTHAFTILIAEDDPPISLIMASILRRMGHTVDVVRDGKEAILQCTLNPSYYDILFTDHEMPNMNGLELVQHLRENEFAGKIIVMSGSLDKELMMAYQALRVHKILQKPFTMKVLMNTLHDLLAQWESEHPAA